MAFGQTLVCFSYRLIIFHLHSIFFRTMERTDVAFNSHDTNKHFYRPDCGVAPLRAFPAFAAEQPGAGKPRTKDVPHPAVTAAFTGFLGQLRGGFSRYIHKAA